MPREKQKPFSSNTVNRARTARFKCSSGVSSWTLGSARLPLLRQILHHWRMQEFSDNYHKGGLGCGHELEDVLRSFPVLPFQNRRTPPVIPKSCLEGAPWKARPQIKSVYSSCWSSSVRNNSNATLQQEKSHVFQGNIIGITHTCTVRQYWDRKFCLRVPRTGLELLNWNCCDPVQQNTDGVSITLPSPVYPLNCHRVTVVQEDSCQMGYNVSSYSQCKMWNQYKHHVLANSTRSHSVHTPDVEQICPARWFYNKQPECCWGGIPAPSVVLTSPHLVFPAWRTLLSVQAHVQHSGTQRLLWQVIHGEPNLQQSHLQMQPVGNSAEMHEGILMFALLSFGLHSRDSPHASGPWDKGKV